MGDLCEPSSVLTVSHRFLNLQCCYIYLFIYTFTILNRTILNSSMLSRLVTSCCNMNSSRLKLHQDFAIVHFRYSLRMNKTNILILVEYSSFFKPNVKLFTPSLNKLVSKWLWLKTTSKQITQLKHVKLESPFS